MNVVSPILFEPRGPRKELLDRWASWVGWPGVGVGPARSGLVLCPSGRVFSDECPWERTQRSAPPPPCHWARGDDVLGGTPSGTGPVGAGPPGVGVVPVCRARTGHRPAQRASRSPSQGRRPWWRIPPSPRPAQRANRSSNHAGHEKNCWPVGPKHVVGVLPGPLGRAGRMAGPLGRLGGCPWPVTNRWGRTAGGSCGPCPIRIGSLPVDAGIFG